MNLSFYGLSLFTLALHETFTPLGQSDTARNEAENRANEIKKGSRLGLTG